MACDSATAAITCVQVRHGAVLGLAELLVEESQLGFLCLRLLQDLLGQSVGLVVHPNR